MGTDELWGLIDRTRPAEPDPDAHARALTEALVAAGPEATVAFARLVDDAMARLYTWDLWGVGYLVLGGMSDDSFEYFRAWIVSEGEAATARAATDPEGYVVDLLAELADDDGDHLEGMAERYVGDGEAMLGVAATAHQRVTGRPLPPPTTRQPDEPAGEPWNEDDLVERFPRAADLTPEGMVGGADDLPFSIDDITVVVGGPDGSTDTLAFADLLDLPGRAEAIQEALDRADDAWNSGDHASVVQHLTPVLDDAATWTLLRQFLDQPISQTVAYQGAISRLQCGDPDGAAAWLGLVADDSDLESYVRRALAQIQLTRGDLDAAEALLDTSPTAEPFDLAIATAAAGYRGDHDRVMTLGRATFQAARAAEQHPWDLAGMNVLVGQALVEVGEAGLAQAAATHVLELTDGAPPELPLVAQGWTLLAAANRLAGDLDAAGLALGRAWERLEPGTCDLGVAQREAARCDRAAGREGDARAGFTTAAATFRAAGERWLAAATDREATAG